MVLRAWITVVTAAVALFVCLAPASPAGAAEPDTVTLNFVNADIDGVVKSIADITGKNFALDPRVKGTVNIVSSRPMPRALVYEVFLSALRLQGFAAVEENGLVKIVPEGDAKLQSGPTLGPQDKSRARGDEIQTRVFVLRYESAAQMVPVLRPLIAPNNVVNAYSNSNTLVITDYASNLRRIEKIIDSIDQPNGNGPVVIPLAYASALDVAQTVSRLFIDPAQAGGGTDAMQRMVVIPDARSNSVLVRSDNPSRLSQLRAVIASLDSPTNSVGNIHVVYLKNAEAVRVAETLRAIYLGEGGGPGSARGIGASALTSPPPASAVSTAGGAAAQSPATTPLNLSASSGGSASSSSPSGMIQADPATNSIIINAPDAIYNSLRAALDKLDVRRAQVYVEALIAEVTADRAAELGVQWQDLSGVPSTTGQARGFGGTNFGTASQNILGIAANPAGAGAGLNIGVIKGTVTLPGVGQVLNLGLLVRALESDSNANILSTPTLLTLDNEEARIVIGQNVPFITGQYALSGAATTPTPFQTVERRDVGLTLRIKPQISQGGTVRLQLYQEVSSVQDTTNVAGVITNKRSIESTVLVDDGQIIVIGGLIQDTVKDGTDKVPVMGDLPLIGGLFRYSTRSRSKTNLMVFLRPTVLRDAARADPLTGDRYDYILGEQKKTQPGESSVLINVPTPTLPAPSGGAPLPPQAPFSIPPAAR
ncbi:MAG TPA: type II secretion system secretin GspD [Burkholderiales bacterium]|nr:type II secretion system secretin GspD [Burkholderiales bacterium]